MQGKASQFNPGLALLSKIICAMTLGLIFAGGIVTSKNVGLAVPDWPTSYGYHMWGMPFSMWKGGVLYEHFHRVLASVVGLLVIIIVGWLQVSEGRKIVRQIGIVCLAIVILQGILGGITVRFFLPLTISVVHAVLAHIFLCLTIILAYSLSREYCNRVQLENSQDMSFFKHAIVLVILIFLQLIIAAYMRHDMKHQGGVAIPDFPTVGGRWIPYFNHDSLEWVNEWRRKAVWTHSANFEITDPIRLSQMIVHFIHRIIALVLVLLCLIFSIAAYRRHRSDSNILESFYILDAFIGLQFILGIFVVWSSKGELITTFHVMVGAGSFGSAILLALRAGPEYGKIDARIN